MTGTVFGRMPDGTAVERVTLSGGGLTAHVLTYGAVLQDLRLDGHAPPLVLGFDRFEDYLAHSKFFGATAGRCANRIGGAAFDLDGGTHRVDPNFLGRHHLHGGSAGMGKRVWTLDSADAASATLSIRQDDGDMGYPGALEARVRIALLPDAVLDIRMTATADKPTLCNLAHHSYWNLSGEPDVLNHRLRIDADTYLPVDAELIPTGAVAPVDGTPFDLRAGPLLREVCGAVHVDHNFCLSRARQPLRDIARLSAGGLHMDIRSTEPGLQVFDGRPLDVPVPGLDGRRMGAHAGIALEPQVWPDAIHHPDWQQAILRPGETYDQHTQFAFSRGDG